jgi:hypothetical protein
VRVVLSGMGGSVLGCVQPNAYLAKAKLFWQMAPDELHEVKCVSDHWRHIVCCNFTKPSLGIKVFERGQGMNYLSAEKSCDKYKIAI